MGDAILCTPALRAIRHRFKNSRICFFARPAVREILSPGDFNDEWLEQTGSDPFAIAKKLKDKRFTQAILFKNSFASALAVFVARIPFRLGYAREGRGLFLTEKLYPPKLANGRFKPVSMLDYYLAIASWLGCDTDDRSLELRTEADDENSLLAVLPALAKADGPVAVFVPGGAFGPSKCWMSERFAQTADRLIDKYNATVVVSVASNRFEQQIAGEICDRSRHKLINLALTPLSLGQLKALFAMADLVVTNDTGPRHIAIAMGRKVVTLFGPNDPAWTDTGCENEIKIVGRAACSPCRKPLCSEKEHLCMEAITVEMVCAAAERLLEDEHTELGPAVKKGFVEVSQSLYVDADFRDYFEQAGLDGIDAVFSFEHSTDITRSTLARYRRILRLELDEAPAMFYLKRYDRPPVLAQLRNRLSHGKRISCAGCDFEPDLKLARLGINTPRTVAYGEEWGKFFEKRSFIVTEEIPDAESLEKQLPGCFEQPTTTRSLAQRRCFIDELAKFAAKFHRSGFRHRDFYLCHIFYDMAGGFYLIDLARVFKPQLFSERFRLKDIAQLDYSAPKRHFSNADRLRFYLRYADKDKLTVTDKLFIRKVIKKAKRMARHDKKHGRPVPFET